MSRTRATPVSNSMADRAGDYVRAYMREEATRSAARAAVRTIEAYRAMHVYPMTKVTLGVRSMVRTETRNDTVRPAQRFKRMDRILDKLVRYPRMRLSQMEDIGGCRVVLPDLDAVYAVADRIMKRWRWSAHVTDYVAMPKSDGYRGVHIIERRDGRLIEVQLRTPGQQQWAESIETYGPRLGYNLKDGQGPADLREYFTKASLRIALEEAGEGPDEDLEREFDTLRQRVTHYFEP